MMLIQISTEPRGPLKVVEELPDAKLAMLEGLNGIGKTLAVRILQLCTGTMPYPQDSLAWSSLREGLGHVTVEVTELEGANRVILIADSADWQTTDEPGPTRDWFQSVTIDGEEVPLEAVRQLIRVHRFAGDEAITETFASLADIAAATAKRWSLRYAAPVESPLAELEGSAEMALELLGNWSLETFGQLKAQAAAAVEDLSSATDIAEQAQQRRDAVLEALESRGRLADIRRRAPGLENELADVDELIRQAQDEREEAQAAITALAARVGRAEPLKLELRNARRTLERNRRDLTEAIRRVTTRASALRLAPERDALREAIDILSQRVEDLHAEQTALDAAPAMRTLLDEVSEELADAESRGLASQVAVEDVDTGVQLSVSQTRAGMLTRRAYLEGQPPPPQAREVSQNLANAVEELNRTRMVSAALDDVSRFLRLVNQNEDRVANALRAGADGAAAEAMEQASDRRRASDETLLQLAATRAALAQQLGASADGTSEEATTRRLAEALERIGITDAQLDEVSTAAEESAYQAQLTLGVAQQKAADARREVARAEAEIQRAAASLAEDDELAWVRAAPGDQLRLPRDADIEQTLAVVEGGRTLAVGVVDRLGGLRGQLGAVERALHGLARRLRGQSPDAVLYVDELQTWLASRFSAWLNNPLVRHELLPESEGDVSVDLSSRQVTWREASGERSRPLEAFSSGEQAFAYTRARLALLDEEASVAANRLIVLDEFGAFIAHDRLQGLLAYLRDRAVDHEHEQVLVVLPLSRDYAAMAKSAVGPEAKRFEGFAEQIDTRKYVAQVLVP